MTHFEKCTDQTCKRKWCTDKRISDVKEHRCQVISSKTHRCIQCHRKYYSSLKEAGEMITKERLEELAEHQLPPTEAEIVDLIVLAQSGLQYQEMKARAEKAEPLAKWVREYGVPLVKDALNAVKKEDALAWGTYFASVNCAANALPKGAE